MRVVARGDDREKGAEVYAEIGRRIGGDGDGLRPSGDDVREAHPGVQTGEGEELGGVVREDVDVVQRVELVAHDGKVARDLVGVPRQGGASSRVEGAVGRAVDL